MQIEFPRAVVAAIERFEGEAQVLEGAIGAYVLGAMVGWRALFVLHSKHTIRRYEDVLGVRFREAFERDGYDADRLQRADVVAAANFWKAVNGELGYHEGRTRLRAVEPF